MKLLNKPSGLTASVTVLVMVLCLFAAQAFAEIAPEALDKVEAAAATGDSGALNSAAYEAAGSALGNGMTVQDCCHQIAFVAVSSASSSGQSIESAVQSAVDGVSAAANELEGTPGVELDTSACAIYGIQTAAEAIGLQEETVTSLINSFLPEPEMPEAPSIETPDIRDRSTGSPI